MSHLVWTPKYPHKNVKTYFFYIVKEKKPQK